MRALVLGCGRVGSGVARELASRGHDVVVVDHQPDALARLGEGFPGRKVLGSVLDRPTLEEAGVADADAVAVVTGNDEINAILALTARRALRVPTVVARLHDPNLADVHQRLGIRTLAPVAWGIRRIADLLTATSVAAITALGTGGVELVEVRVPALLDGRPAGELEVPGEIDVIAITRHGRTTLTAEGRTLHTGDLVHLAVAAASHGRLEALLDHRQEQHP